MIQLTVDDDFDLNKIMASGQCFRAAAGPDGTCFFITGSHILYLRQTGAGLSGVSLEAECSVREWQEIWYPYFDLGRSYRAVTARISADDAYLAAAAAFSRGIRVLRQDPWEMLISFLLSQRKNIPAIRKSIASLCRLCGTPQETSRGTVYLFPAPAALAGLSDSELKSCGAGYRVPYLQDAARRVLAGELDTAHLQLLSDPELLASLKGVLGVGDKVAGCVALFAFGRGCCVPVDVWIRRTLQKYYPEGSPLAPYGEDAGILQQFLFYYALQHREELS